MRSIAQHAKLQRYVHYCLMEEESNWLFLVVLMSKRMNLVLRRSLAKGREGESDRLSSNERDISLALIRSLMKGREEEFGYP